MSACGTRKTEDGTSCINSTTLVTGGLSVMAAAAAAAAAGSVDANRGVNTVDECDAAVVTDAEYA
jgi:hypothetical protein